MSAINRNDVVNCYRHILGREPENEAVIRHHLATATDFWSLINNFTHSAEFLLHVLGIAGTHKIASRRKFWPDFRLRLRRATAPSTERALSDVDREIRAAVSRGDLEALAAGYHWFHSIDLGQGVVTKGSKSLALVEHQAEAFFGRLNLIGKSVIDIGAWNGAFSIAAKRRGAARVLAADSFTWQHKRFRGFETFALARAATALDIEDLVLDIEERPPMRAKFDVVLFAGVFYHLKNPLAGLINAAQLANDCLIVETYVDNSLPRASMVFYPGDELAGDASNWWGPNERLIALLLNDIGFRRIEVTSVPEEAHCRRIFHAWR